MNISLRFVDGPGCSDTERRSMKKIRASLDHVAWRIHSIAARFTDVNGPKGGLDAVCTMEVALRGRGAPVVARAVAETPQQALALAVVRARRQLTETARRRRGR